jgi:hypothetical protein
VRWRAVILGAILVAVAFIAGSRVADTREGLVFEVLTLLSGLAGASFLIYGLAARTRPSKPDSEARSQTPLPTTDVQVRSANDVLVGAAGLVVAAVLVSGIAVSLDLLWALLGMVLLLPMVAGCSYLLIRFARAPKREWKLDLRRLTRSLRG